MTQGVEIGAGWIRRSEISGRDYASLSLAAPESGTHKLVAKLGGAVGDDDASIVADGRTPAS